MLGRRQIIFLLVGLCLIITSFMAWRWLWLIPSDIETIRIRNHYQQAAHPFDQLIQNNLNQLLEKPTLTQQFAEPSTLTNISSLWVDQCEVNQQDFGRYRQWTGLQAFPPSVHPLQPKDYRLKSHTAGHQLLGRLNMPAGGTSLFEAYAYCQAAGGRLPTSAEFMAIASGKQQRLYPWGNQLDTQQLRAGWPFRDAALNVQSCGETKTLATPEGVQDLGNNLLEWTLDGFDQAALMGGNAFHRPVDLHALNLIKRPAPLDYRSQYSGFRCVYPRLDGLDEVQRQAPWGSLSSLIPIPSGWYPAGPPVQATLPKMLQLLEPEQFKQLQQLPLTIEPIDVRLTKHEIQVQHYRRFLRDPLVQMGFFDHPKQPLDISHRPPDWMQQQQQPHHPITNISWWSAYAFADWLGGRLMTNRQWRSIAGSAQTLYPWGNQYQPGRSIDRHHPANKWQPRDAWLSDDANPEGVLGLAGNVAEWTSSVVHYGNQFHVLIKGGSYLLPAQAGQVLQTAAVSPNYRNPDLGFRVIFEIAKRTD